MKHSSQNPLHKKISKQNHPLPQHNHTSPIKFSDPHYTKHLNYILKQDQKQNVFQFPKIQNDVQKITELIIDQILKDRNTILLAKLAKESILQFQNKQTKLSYHQSVREIQDPMIVKSLDQINQFYCTEISSKVVKRVVQYLKSKNLYAKVMVASIIIQNPKYGFNIGGMCFWNNLSDGQKTIRRKIPALKGFLRVKESGKGQQQSFQNQSRNEQFQREGLLVVTIYLCKFERKFRSK